MGLESLATSSPAHRRLQNPSSPPSGFRKSASQFRDDTDLGWRALVRRHKFLLFMLGLLAFLCTIYLYFAMTLGAESTCAGLSGTSMALCRAKHTHIGKKPGARTLLSAIQYSSSSILAGQLAQGVEDCSKEYANYAPCSINNSLKQFCRMENEPPLLCKIPVPQDYCQRTFLEMVHGGLEEGLRMLYIHHGYGSFTTLRGGSSLSAKTLTLSKISHNWCEAFPSYPRAFDIIDVHGLFSLGTRCNILHILLEVDRILRPGGSFHMHDDEVHIPHLEMVAQSLGWIVSQKAESYSSSKKVLVCIKQGICKLTKSS